MLVGQTGNGKTTFLNSLINCLMGIKYKMILDINESTEQINHKR